MPCHAAATAYNNRVTHPAAARPILNAAVRGLPPFARFDRGDLRIEIVQSPPVVLDFARSSSLHLSPEDFTDRIETLAFSEEGQILKQDRASIVLARPVAIQGHSIDLVIKRPAVRDGLRGSIKRFGPSRVRRTWLKTWKLLLAGIAAEHPLFFVERRRGGKLIEQAIAFERVPGPTLYELNLDSLDDSDRNKLLADCGRVLAKIESQGWTHFDTKTTNWIVTTNPDGTLAPVMIDCDGLRGYRWRGAGLERLLRSIRSRSDFRESDANALIGGYRS